jgi:hypothetical protein
MEMGSTSMLSREARVFMTNTWRWLVAGLGLITGALFLLTVVNADWLEAIGIDPDGGDGSVERLIVGGLALVTIVLFSIASYQWGKASAARA